MSERSERTRPATSAHRLEVAYARVEVPDRAALAEFWTDVIGLAPGPDTAAGDWTFTDDAAVQRLVVAEGPRNDLTALGFEAVDEAAYDATLAALAAAGFPTTPGSAELAAERRVGRIATVAAPWGSDVEVVGDLERTAAVPALPSMPGGFLTDGVGFGHAVVGTTAFDEAVRFAAALGLVRSDWLEMELAPGVDLEVSFFHCNQRHHSLAIARAPFELPQALHHLMVETNDRDDVGAAYDRAIAVGLPLPNGLGRHDNDGMFSFYVASPAGFQVEVGHGARLITDPWTDDRRYDRISAWGHHPVLGP